MIDPPLSVRVDFNRADDDDIIWAFRERASNPSALVEGGSVRLYDYEGNECLGHVVRLDERILRIRPEWSTWRDAEPVRPEVIIGQDLFDALRASVAESRRRSLFRESRQETRPIYRKGVDLVSAE